MITQQSDRSMFIASAAAVCLAVSVCYEFMFAAPVRGYTVSSLKSCLHIFVFFYLQEHLCEYTWLYFDVHLYMFLTLASAKTDQQLFRNELKCINIEMI